MEPAFATDSSLTSPQLLQTIRVRDQADRLLQKLIAERDACEQRLIENGKRDLIKCVTGRSSLDQAILTTRQMISDMDDLLAQMNQELDDSGLRSRELQPLHAT